MQDATIEDFESESDGQPPIPADAVAEPAPVAAAPEPEPDPDDVSEEEKAAASEAGKTLSKKRQSYQQRINDITLARAQAERRAAELERRLQDVERGTRQPAQEQAPNAPQPFTGPEPTLDQFADQSDPYAAWMRAVSRWEVDERLASAQHASAVAQADRANRERLAAYQARLEEARTKHADYDAVVTEKGRDLFPTDVMREYLLADEHGPEMQRFLCLHPEEFHRIAGLPPGRALVELGKLETRLDAAPSGPAQPPKLTNAKPPIKPVGHSPGASDDGEVSSDTTDDFDTHVAVMNAKDRQRRRRP